MKKNNFKIFLLLLIFFTRVLAHPIGNGTLAPQTSSSHYTKENLQKNRPLLIQEILTSREIVIESYPDKTLFTCRYIPYDATHFKIKIYKGKELAGAIQIGNGHCSEPFHYDDEDYGGFKTYGLYVPPHLSQIYTGIGRSLISIAMSVLKETTNEKSFEVYANLEVKDFYRELGMNDEGIIEVPGPMVEPDEYELFSFDLESGFWPSIGIEIKSSRQISKINYSVSA